LKRRENSHSLIIIFINILLYQTNLAVGQSQSSPIQFHGSNTLVGQYSNMPGVGSEIPASFYRNDLKLTLTIYDVPISASFFLTSMQRDYRQSINNFRIYLDVAALMKTKKLADAKGLAMSKMARFLSNFNALEIGKCRPNYSELTLKGVALSGANIEFNPGLFYIAFATGTVTRAVSPSVYSEPAFKQNLLFGKLGVGRKKESHFYLTFMKAEDKVNSLPGDVGMDTLGRDTLHIGPRSNYVVGTEAKLSFLKKKFTIEGEAAVSMLTRDTQSPALDPENSDVPTWLNDFLKPNMSSSVDFAYDVKSALNLKTTTISIGIKMVGPGYISLGNPNLINDRVTYEGRIDQALVKNQVSLSAYYRQSHDNLIDWKKSATNMIAYGLIAGLRFSKLPYLQFSYTPYFQKTERDSFKLDNSVRVITALTGYNYQIGTLRSNTMFSFFYQGTETLLDTNKINSQNLTYTLTEELTFTIPLSLTAGASFNQFEFAVVHRSVLLFTLSATYRAFKNKWQNSLGVKYSNQFSDQNKLGFFLNSKVQLWKMVDLEIRIENNNFHDNLYASNNYNEFIAQSTLVVKW
jgi:hypothetical protein